jgi:(p)ppGpp synthase/HD superfamily hydrolase
MDMLFSLDQLPAERARRLQVRASGPRSEDLAAATAGIVEAVPAASRPAIHRALAYVAALEYRGSPLGAAIYLAHVYRVTELSLAADRESPAAIALLALLHNVMEVASVSGQELAEQFGDALAQAVGALTVDRQQQFDLAYKATYYRGIANLGSEVRVVKVCDKIDNLFTLCLNPDQAARERYIGEVRRFVAPLASTVSTGLEQTVMMLADDAERTGHWTGGTQK